MIDLRDTFLSPVCSSEQSDNPCSTAYASKEGCARYCYGSELVSHSRTLRIAVFVVHSSLESPVTPLETCSAAIVSASPNNSANNLAGLWEVRRSSEKNIWGTRQSMRLALDEPCQLFRRLAHEICSSVKIQIHAFHKMVLNINNSSNC